MSNPFVLPRQVPVGSSGVYPGAKAYFYVSGTSTPKNIYSDAALTTPHANPVVADGQGSFPPIYLDSGQYKLALKTAADVSIYTVDPIADSSLSQADFDALLMNSQQSIIGGLLYPRSAAEIAAGVTPAS